MKLWIGITDYDWFKLHSSKPSVEEVNFWRSTQNFKVLKWGEPFLFKLHAPANVIVGGGFFTKFLKLPIRIAWETFGEANGARSYVEFRRSVAKYQKLPTDPTEDHVIGCVLLEEPFFFDEPEWIPVPVNFKQQTVQGKSYSTDEPTGLALWQEVTLRLNAAKVKTQGPATLAAQESARFGKPTTVIPRLGQGSFRVLVRDAYNYRCAMSGERTLPVLDTAHIRPYSKGGEHALSNGLLLRSDLHTLFDLGYLTVDPDEMRIVVSEQIKANWENGKDYYKLHGQELAKPVNTLAFPSMDSLRYHTDRVFERRFNNVLEA